MCHQHGLGRRSSGHIVEEGVAVSLPAGESMPGALFSPTDAATGSVVLVSDIYGMTDFYLDLARVLADEGFMTLVVDYFFREGGLQEGTREEAFARKQRCDEERTIGDVGAAVDWLGRRAGTEGSRTGVLGFCLGGTLGLDLAAEREDLAVVSYYGFPASMPGPDSAPAPIDLADSITGPILAFWGDQDPNIPVETIDKFANLMREHDVDYEQTVYPGVGHGFLAGLADENASEDDPAWESWRRTLEFLRRELGGSDEN